LNVPQRSSKIDLVGSAARAHCLCPLSQHHRHTPRPARRQPTALATMLWRCLARGCAAWRCAPRPWI